MATIRDLVVRISVTEKTDKGIRRVTTSLRETNRELDNANKDSNRFSGTLSKLGRTSMSKLTKGLSAVASVTKTAAVGLLAVGTAAASLNTAVQAGASLAPLTGLLALLPAAALSGAAALVTLKVATAGVGDAFSAAMSGDSKKFTEALKNLAPAARKVATEVKALRPTLLGIRNVAQQALFNPLVGQMTALAKALSGTVSQGISRVAVQIGLAGKQVAEFARQRKSVQLVADTFQATQVSLGNLRPAIQPVLAGFRSLAEVGLSFLPGIASSVSTIATRFGQWMQKMAASGKAAQWIQNALATLKQLGGILKNVGGILGSVFKAASAAGSGFLGVLGEALSKLNAFLKTAQGQAALQSIFKGLAAIGTALGPIIGALVTALGALAGPVGRLAQLVGPILTTAIQALAPALAALEPGLAAIFGALGSVVTILAPALMPLATAISQIAVALAPVLPLLATFIAQLVGALAPILSDLVGALSPLIKAVVQLAGAFAPLIPPIAQIIVQLVQGLVPVLVPLIGIIGQIVGVVGGFFVQALQMLMRALAPIIPVIGQVAAQFGTALLTVLVALAPALLQILQALMPLVPTFVQLLPPVAQLVVAVAPLLAILIQLAAVILGVLLPPIVKLQTFITGALADAFGTIATVVSTVLGGIVKVFQWLYNTLIGHSIIPDLINGMVKWFGSLPGKIVKFFVKLAEGAVQKMVDLIKYMKGVPGKILSALGKTTKILYQAGKNVVIGLWNGIASLSGWLSGRVWYWVKRVLPAPVKFALGISSPSKVMAELGVFAGQGLAEGILGTAGTVANAAGVLADAALPAIPGAIPTASTAASLPSAAAPRGVAAAAGAGATITLEVRSSGRAVDDFLAEMIRKYVRVQGGGDVQVAFGRS